MAANGAGGLSKATLRVDVGETSRTELRFLYNPTEYTVTKGATWNRPQTKGAKSTGKPEFGGTNPQTVQMEIFFDDWEAREGTIAEDIAALLEWTKPTSQSVQRRRPEPPILVFEWGENPALTNFRGYLKTVTAKYTLFDDEGKPLRATANVTLEEVPTEAAKTNPTSGGRLGYRSHVVQEGESLHSLAYREYGDPALWRALALYNELDDPLRLPVGTRLLVPEVAEASRLVGR
jgi:nucleoid-associated protein YgaU